MLFGVIKEIPVGWFFCGVASPVTSCLAQLEGTVRTAREIIRMPTSGLGGRVAGVLFRGNCVLGCGFIRSNPRNAVGITLGCSSIGGIGTVGGLVHISAPNVHGCANCGSVREIVGKLNVTVVSASGNMVASGRTTSLGVNNRILYCMCWLRSVVYLR